MDHLEAAVLMKEFQAFFGEIPGFVEVDFTRGRVRFVHDYPEKNLRIYVAAPILKQGPDFFIRIPGQLFITFEIQHNKKTCLEFRDSRAIEGWQQIARKKIETLQKLIEGSRPCSDPDCKGAYPRPIEESTRQGKPRPTRYVIYECTGRCEIRTETKYGIGLKEAVSRYLKPLKKK